MPFQVESIAQWFASSCTFKQRLSFRPCQLSSSLNGSAGWMADHADIGELAGMAEMVKVEVEVWREW